MIQNFQKASSGMNRIFIEETTKQEGKRVAVIGWVQGRRDHGKIVFLDLRDKTGVLQVVITPAQQEAYEIAQRVRPEWLMRILGTVQARPEKLQNPALSTGKIEMSAETLEVISESKTPPFSLEGDGYDINEELRWKYRYLDMRRPRVAQNLQIRHRMKHAIRNFLTERGFTEVDTPILTKSTPEGARDFLVPSRNFAGKFYALPQSPQQYKQLLMIGGLEKYFQFPRCFRDEDLRADRLLEFDQLDIEMSFVDQEDILRLAEELVIDVTENILHKRIQEKPFPRMTHKEAMETYKTDRPDIRKDKEDKDCMAYCWVVDFPMFEQKEDGTIGPAHHPFTAIADDDIVKLKEGKDLLSVRAKQYDLVLNGFEVFGGSIRTTDPEILTKVFELLGHSPEEIQERFGHLLEAFSYGVPPHGGIANGFDRWLSVLLNEPSVREVVPFPTTGSGRTSVMDAPSSVDEQQLKELHIKILE